MDGHPLVTIRVKRIKRNERKQIKIKDTYSRKKCCLGKYKKRKISGNINITCLNERKRKQK